MTKQKIAPTGLKFVTLQIKEAGEKDGLKVGQFTGYASVFGNKDSYGDVVIKGAFADTLQTYDAGGAGVPVYWQHRMDDPMMNIGITLEAKEDDHGLFVKVQLDLDNPNGAQTHKLIKEGRVRQMSFAFTVKEHGWVDTEDDSYLELRKLDLHEVSVVPVGANQETTLDAVKSMFVGSSEETKAIDLLLKAVSLIRSQADEATKEPEKEVSDEEPIETKAVAEESLEVKAQDDDPDSALALISLALAGVNF